MLTLHIGDIFELPSIKNRVFDYYTLDFYPEDPDSTILGFVKTDKDVSEENELRKYIYLNLKYFGTSFRRRIYLDGPDLHLGSTPASGGVKILKIKVHNSRALRVFDFRFIIKKGIDPIEIKPN